MTEQHSKNEFANWHGDSPTLWHSQAPHRILTRVGSFTDHNLHVSDSPDFWRNMHSAFYSTQVYTLKAFTKQKPYLCWQYQPRETISQGKSCPPAVQEVHEGAEDHVRLLLDVGALAGLRQWHLSRTLHLGQQATQLLHALLDLRLHAERRISATCHHREETGR